MSRRQKLPPNVEPDLPPFDPSQASIDNSSAMADPNFVPPVTDDYMDTAPEEVVNDVANQQEVRRAEPVMQPTGSVFGLGFIEQINSLPEAEARKAYDALTPVQKRIYDRAFGYEEVTATKAEQWADEFYKMQDEQMKAQPQDPAKARESAQQAARLQSIIGIMDTYSAPDSDLDNLVGPAVGSWAANEWDKWNNPDRYAQRFELSSVTKNEVLEAAKFVKPLSNDERKFLEEMFPRRDDPPQVWRSYFKRSRDILSKGMPEQPQQQGAAPSAPPSSQPPPNLPPTRIDPVTGQTMQLTQNQQGRWVYRMAPQQQSQTNVTGR